MNNRPLTATEGALCLFVALLLGALAGEWEGFFHWWALVGAVLFGITAFAVACRHIGRER